jgi:sec-independent protein translocase protein TatA
MPEIGIPELLIILVIVLIIFGPGRLNGVGAALGRTLQELRQGLQGRAEDSITEESSPDNHQ